MFGKIRRTPYMSTSSSLDTQNAPSAFIDRFAQKLHMILDFQSVQYDTYTSVRELVGNLYEQNTRFIFEFLIHFNQERKTVLPLSGGERFFDIQKTEIRALILQQLRVLVVNPYILFDDIVYIISPLLQCGIFSDAEKDDISTGITQYFQDYRKTQQEFITYDRATGQRAKELLTKVAPSGPKQALEFHQLKGEVLVRIYRGSVIFFFENSRDYAKLCAEHRQGEFISGGMYFSEPHSPEYTFGNTVFVNGFQTDEVVVLHEIAHRKSIYTNEFTPSVDYDGITDIFAEARGEIISFLEEGMSIGELKDILLDYKGGYNPIPNRRPNGRKKKAQVWGYYAKRLDRYIDDAFEVKRIYPNLFMYLLASTPINFWKYLYKK